ncbi:MAG: ribose 5-phosphate isomerase B [Deltaproteobacteria bacterium RIFCSPHIGHO2_12_FULL_43_9]|nr:MAG: ribose 5-phosphate isomerase B [Deltaproteobacteria bacterium RIFCSPHIGHO2_12_FULL_43_9]
MSSTKILIASDHAGLELKNKIIESVKNKGVVLEDLGTYNTDSVDYPDKAVELSKKITSNEFSRGILICGTGIGMSIVANRFPGVRAALVQDPYSAKMAREHNDANVLVLGGRVVKPEIAMELVDIFLNTKFEGGRHQQRVDKINKIGLGKKGE